MKHQEALSKETFQLSVIGQNQTNHNGESER